MSDDKDKKDHSLGNTALLLGGGAMLAISVIDGTALVLAGSAALGYCSWWAVNKYLMPDEAVAKKGRGDRIRRDENVIRYIVAGCCAVSTFLNPFLGVPGTVILLIMWNGWRNECKNFIADAKEKAKETAKKVRETVEETVDYGDAMGETSW